MKYKVIIVDDEYMIKRSLYKLITESEHGFEIVGEAEDGQEALELAIQKLPDLIITDISMPIMDGLEFIRECRDRQLPCEFVILSGYGEFEYARQALQSEVTDYLLKPVRTEQLDNVLRAIRNKLDSKRKMVSDRSVWLWYCKTIGQRWACLIWDLDEKQIQAEMASAYFRYIEQTSDIVQFKHLCFELLMFIQKELEQCAGKEVRGADFSLFQTVSDPLEAWRLLEANLMNYVRDVRTKRNHGAFQGIKQAVAYIEQHYMDEDLSLQSIAEQMNMSLSYASQSFKETAGVSFVQFLTGLRMEKAKELLHNSNCKTYEAAQAVGYNDYPHFTKTFKKYFGYTPREYRKRMGFD
ncbi:two-component system, response regulator YesN [Paenibacillus sp. 1_12]|uniref:response regulator transcription factor n=1 Tax=Paenibacillus sp. 1_12 TaxID=1566278 RepID=UPI0008F42103|nr:response regulator [Paenibacillus sp. 1_12]SFL77268.1 two-component system, response regulator YesN [Paenibacillus sp. 1_12]